LLGDQAPALQVDNRTLTELFIAPGMTVEPCGRRILTADELAKAIDAQADDSFVAPSAPGDSAYLSLHVLTINPRDGAPMRRLLATSTGVTLDADGAGAQPPCSGEFQGPG
jgi:hypothetical protein